jgi:alginate O-acetyltransferase complex protein AlgI
VLFNSLEFLILFLPAVLVVATRLRGRALLGWICAASATFYALAGHAWFLLPMAITTTLDYVVGLRLDGNTSSRNRVPYLLISLCGNLGLLAYFKYSGLVLDTVDVIAGGETSLSTWRKALHVALPAGISFYTFQTLSYVIDVYRGHAKAERNFFAYLGFVSFFPHLVAGPLTRHKQLIPQLLSLSKTGIHPRWWSGIHLFSIGLCKKVLIADRIASFIDPVIGQIDQQGIIGSWLAVIGYAMQIYFDFSGYSDMALGLARMFDIDLPQNFDSPYKALDPSDFWRRWHITLSQWLRDYLYIPLGGNRASPNRVRFNLLLTMALGGLWHGANWTFLAWGVYHGVLLVAYQGNRERWDALPAAVRRGTMFVLVCVGWVFFRSPSVKVAGVWLANMAGASGLGTNPGLRMVALIGAAFVVTQVFKNPYEKDSTSYPAYAQAALGLAMAGAVVMMNFSSKFLYFQF